MARAIGLHQAGRLTEAEALYRGILEESPQEPEALHLLGVLSHQAGRHLEAVDLISRALTGSGPQALYHSSLAAAYLALDRLDEGAAHAREALHLDSRLHSAHNHLGVALRRQEQLGDAEQCFRTALRINPGYIDALTNLGATLHQQGRLSEALPLLEDAVRRAPGSARVHNDLGAVLLALGEQARAQQHLDEAIRLNRGEENQRPTRLSNRLMQAGVVLETLNRGEEAKCCYQEAVRLDPSYVAARTSLGHSLEVQGRLDEAAAAYREILRYEPSNPLALSHLVNLAAVGRHQLSATEVWDVQTLAARPDLSFESRLGLHHALVSYLDKSGFPDVAFAHARQAKDMRKEAFRQAGAAYDSARHSQYVTRLISFFTPAHFERLRQTANVSRTSTVGPSMPGPGVDSDLPIFIVGMMRSGTTLAEQILASHPRVHGAGELDDLGNLTRTLPRRLGTREDAQASGTAEDGYPECLARLDAVTARAVANEYLQKLQQLGGTATRVVDKMPMNFFQLGLIATLFPGARVIHCRRDPVDVCLSCYFQNFAHPHLFTLDLRHLGHYYREYERLMNHWTRVLPLPILDLHYEELTADQEGASRRLLAFCGLEWDDRCLRFHHTQRVVQTSSILQVRQPMYRSSVGRWKRYEAHLQPLLEALREGDPGASGGT
jgi:tetratricopeptide (TPR) repeat protein